MAREIILHLLFVDEIQHNNAKLCLIILTCISEVSHVRYVYTYNSPPLITRARWLSELGSLIT
jgi:hypothetical protein